MIIFPSPIPLKPLTQSENIELLKRWKKQYNDQIKVAYRALDQDGLTLSEKKNLIEGIESFEKMVKDIDFKTMTKQEIKKAMVLALHNYHRQKRKKDGGFPILRQPEYWLNKYKELLTLKPDS